MRKTTIISIYGGFHNRASTHRAQIDAAGNYFLTDSQIERMNKIHCGSADCTCGGSMRCKFADPDGNILHEIYGIAPEGITLQSEENRLEEINQLHASDVEAAAKFIALQISRGDKEAIALFG